MPKNWKIASQARGIELTPNPTININIHTHFHEQEKQSNENSSSIEIPVAYDSSSGTEQPEPDILTIEHPVDDKQPVTTVVIRPSTADVLESTK